MAPGVSAHCPWQLFSRVAAEVVSTRHSSRRGGRIHSPMPHQLVPPVPPASAQQRAQSSTTVEAAELVVHRLASRFILRRGPIVGCVENRSFAGAGEPPPTGTVTPAVKRHTVGVRP